MDNRLQYTCDSCHTFIVPLNPRVRCLVCADYDLCAICALGERFTPGHTGDHSTQVFKYCGGNGQAPVPASSYTTTVPPATPYSLPQYTETSVPSETRQPDLSGPENPRPAANYPPPEGSRQPGQWEPWFHPDSSPTEAYTTLMNDIFSLLDPTNVGNLVPETFSRFLDDMGYLPHENSWKSGLQSTRALSQEAMADKALKSTFDRFSIDHVLLKRLHPPSPGKGAGPMPAITRSGFIEITRVEALADPAQEWGNFSRLLRKYNLPRYSGWGDVPRSVLPGVPDASMLARIAGVTAEAQRQGQQRLNASRVAAQLRAQGEQNAIDLISDTRVEYRYY